LFIEEIQLILAGPRIVLRIKHNFFLE